MSLPPAVRLDRLLANLGYGSRREVHALVRERA
ncbi:MAG: 16S rRNA pseudouridine(516) synthase, partial [Phenylobacterium sp.]|nr:16S rRNA pseudouridine(516) synthase [Phenylobacterium sp.]